jgi:hypothetical protein
MNLFEALEKALKSGTFTDETFSKIILPKYNQISTYLKNTKPSIDTLPSSEEVSNIFLKSFQN